MIKKEFDIEQIDLISRFLFTMLFSGSLMNVKQLNEFQFDSNLLDLKAKLSGLIDEQEFVSANELLLKEIEKSENFVGNDAEFREIQISVLRLAFWFYCKLNDFSDDILKIFCHFVWKVKKMLYLCD